MLKADWITKVIEWFEQLKGQVIEMVEEMVEPTEDFVGYETFPRSIQLDNFSCAARSVFAILEHFNKATAYRNVKAGLHTDSDGTDGENIVKYLRKRGFTVNPRDPLTLKQMNDALAQGAVILVDLDGDHVGVVYGMTAHSVLLSDPSWMRAPLMGPVNKTKFQKRWDKSGAIIKLKAHR